MTFLSVFTSMKQSTPSSHPTHVDLAVFVRRAKVLGHDSIAQASHVEVCFHLTIAGCFQVFRAGLSEKLRGGAQSAGYKSREPDHRQSKNWHRLRRQYVYPGVDLYICDHGHMSVYRPQKTPSH